MGEGIDRMKEWFGRALRAADFDLQLQDKEKGSSWKEATPLFLFNKMMRHVNLMMDPNTNVGQVHSIKVVNYALMITTLMAGDKVVEEAKPQKTVIREIIYPGAGHMEQSDVEWGPPIIAGEDESKPKEKGLESAHEEEDRIGEPPLEAESESESYYCPWCQHTSTLGEGCRGKICCIKCGKPINSRFAKLLKKARQWDYVIMKKPVTSAKTAQYLGTSTSWAGKVLRELGWERTRWRGVIWWRWNLPKEDGK